jgi:hypothetical protein
MACPVSTRSSHRSTGGSARPSVPDRLLLSSQTGSTLDGLVIRRDASAPPGERAEAWTLRRESARLIDFR